MNLRRSLEASVFRAQLPHNLGVSRFFFYILLFWYWAPYWHYMQLWADVPDIFWQPIGIFVWFSPLHWPQLMSLTALTWTAAMFLSALGLFTRWSTKVVFLLGFMILGYSLNFGKVDSQNHLPFLIMGILAFSNCGAAFSLDSVWLRFRKGVNTVRRPSAEYGWPIRLIQLAMVITYFEAGFQKLRHSGLEWIFSDNMSLILMNGTPTGQYVALNFPILCKVMAAITLTCEILAPLSLKSWRFALPLMGGLFMFHVGSRILMGDAGNFFTYMVCFVFWIPWRGRNS